MILSLHMVISKPLYHSAYSFFIQSSVHVHLDSFHILAIVVATMHRTTHVFSVLCFFDHWGNFPEVNLLAHMEAQFFVFGKVSLLSTKKAGPVNISCQHRMRVPFSTTSLPILAAIGVCQSFWLGMISHSCFDLNFPNN